MVAVDTIMAHLTSNNVVGERHDLVKESYILGRHPECDIIVDAGAVSRHHARITRESSNFFIEDMKSRNGTFVNGRMVFGKYALSDGDLIRVCDVSFTFHGDSPATDTSNTYTVLLEDSAESTMSQVMSRLDIAAEDSHVGFSASTEAKLQALLEITRSLGKSISLDQVLPQVLNSIFKIFLQADRGFIVLREQGGQLIPRWTKLRHDTSNETIRISKTIVSQVIESKQAILSADATSDERFDMSQSIADFRIRSLICAPLMDADGNVMGVIQIDTKDQGKKFRQEDLDVLGSIAIQSGIAIDNAQMHEDLIKQREIERDLEVAREVQKGFLPKARPTISGYDFFDFYEPANHVGGDYYDYVLNPDGRLAIVVADVVGHGIAAALLMSKLSGAAKHALSTHSKPSEALSYLNKTLFEGEFDGRFITLVLGLLDPESHELTYVTAGHTPPIVKQKKEIVFDPETDTIGYPLLIDADATYKETTVKLEKGDILVFFTDGLNEAMLEDGTQFGFDGINKCLDSATVTKVGENIVSGVNEFLGDQPKKDDMCVVCVQRG